MARLLRRPPWARPAPRSAAARRPSRGPGRRPTRVGVHGACGRRSAAASAFGRAPAAAACPTTCLSAARTSGRSVVSVVCVSRANRARAASPTRSSRPSRSISAAAACVAARSAPGWIDSSSMTTSRLRAGSAAKESVSVRPVWRRAASTTEPGPRLTCRTQSTRRGLPSTVTVKLSGPRPSTNLPSRSTTTTSTGVAPGGAAPDRAVSRAANAKTAPSRRRRLNGRSAHPLSIAAEHADFTFLPGSTWPTITRQTGTGPGRRRIKEQRHAEPSTVRSGRGRRLAWPLRFPTRQPGSGRCPASLRARCRRSPRCRC